MSSYYGFSFKITTVKFKVMVNGMRHPDWINVRKESNVIHMRRILIQTAALRKYFLSLLANGIEVEFGGYKCI